MSVDSCIHPDCECLDYCRAKDPHTKSPERIKEPMKRESRYTVIKYEDADKYLTDAERMILNMLAVKITMERICDKKDALKCVVVESSWPEYEPTWEAIEKRIIRDHRW